MTESSPEEVLSAARAAFANGRMLQGRSLLQACARSGHPDYAARAGALLADLALARGDADGAERQARSALERATGEGRVAATMSLAGVLAARGEDEEAERLYREVRETAPPAQAAMAAFNLGVLFTLSGQIDRAKTALRTAIDSGDPEAAPRAAVNLGALLAGAGDREGATAAFESAAASGHPEQTAKARLNLLALRERYGEPPPDEPDAGERLLRVAGLQTEAGRLLFTSARGQRDPLLQANVYVSLLEVARKLSVLARTPEEFRTARDACRGAVRIGEMLAKRFPYDPGHHGLGPSAAIRLGDLLRARDMPKDARKWYARAHKAGVKLARTMPASAAGPLTAARSCRHLATVERPERARALLEEGADWIRTATEREPAYAELPYERCLLLWRLGAAAPDAAADAAAQIIADFGDLEGSLPPEAAEALTWARGLSPGPGAGA